MNILFLDIDGVLNSVGSMVAFAQDKELERQSKLSQVSIGLLKRACIECNIKIVISSTWRIGRTEKDFIDLFNSCGWSAFPIIGITPRNKQVGMVRGNEIQDWLDSNPGWKNYCILDDDSDMLESQYNNFIHVSNVNGLQLKHYTKILRLFGKPDERLEKQVNFVRLKNIGI